MAQPLVAIVYDGQTSEIKQIWNPEPLGLVVRPGERVVRVPQSFYQGLTSEEDLYRSVPQLAPFLDRSTE